MANSFPPNFTRSVRLAQISTVTDSTAELLQPLASVPVQVKSTDVAGLATIEFPLNCPGDQLYETPPPPTIAGAN
jgi:hypothetical protein